MSKRLTKEDFITKACKVHGDKYDYSKVKYVNTSSKVCIICPIHGEFFQLGSGHLRGYGCPKCGKQSITKKVNGIGINDVRDYHPTLYKIWKSMLYRCKNYQLSTVCEEWKILSNFKEWFDEHYVEGWYLDKDILVKGNYEYSPDKCCFVPSEISNTFINTKNVNSLKIAYNRNGKYRASIGRNKYKTFKNKNDALNAYINHKEERIKTLADKYKYQLEPRVYEALCNYKVEITD